MALFTDRADAGRVLAARLARWRGTDAVVAGIARGGVVVAAAVARALELPLTAVAVRKLGVPGHEEFALGAIADGVRTVDERIRRASRTSAAALAAVERRERDVLRRRTAIVGAPDVAGRTVLLVDDGIATGATANTAGRAIRAAGAARVILAVPVAPSDWWPDPDAADDYVCAHSAAQFWAVGAFYDHFHETTDEEIARILDAG